MAREIGRVAIEIEHYSGETYFGFLLATMDDGSVRIIETRDCSLADTDSDYLFNTEHELYRMQAEKPITKDTYYQIQESYLETELGTE